MIMKEDKISCYEFPRDIAYEYNVGGLSLGISNSLKELAKRLGAERYCGRALTSLYICKLTLKFNERTVDIIRSLFECLHRVNPAFETQVDYEKCNDDDKCYTVMSVYALPGFVFAMYKENYSHIAEKVLGPLLRGKSFNVDTHRALGVDYKILVEKSLYENNKIKITKSNSYLSFPIIIELYFTPNYNIFDIDAKRTSENYIEIKVDNLSKVGETAVILQGLVNLSPVSYNPLMRHSLHVYGDGATVLQLFADADVYTLAAEALKYVVKTNDRIKIRIDGFMATIEIENYDDYLYLTLKEDLPSPDMLLVGADFIKSVLETRECIARIARD